MKRVTVAQKDWSPASKHQRVTETLTSPVLSGDVVAQLPSGEPVAAVAHLRGEDRKAATLLGKLIHRGIPWNDAAKPKPLTEPQRGSARTSGIRYPNQTFGTTAPQAMRRRYGCRYAGFHEQRPDIVALLAEVFSAGWRLFQETLPEVAAATESKTRESVHPDWLFGQTPWTSGIINDVVALPYHRDAGNIVGTWSAMVVLRKDTGGGVLHLPEYDFGLECGDLSMTFFNGQAAWHGVTPVTLRNSMAYRRSIVMYTKAGCRECGPADEEAARAARVATEHDVPHETVFTKAER